MFPKALLNSIAMRETGSGNLPGWSGSEGIREGREGTMDGRDPPGVRG